MIPYRRPHRKESTCFETLDLHSCSNFLTDTTNGAPITSCVFVTQYIIIMFVDQWPSLGGRKFFCFSKLVLGLLIITVCNFNTFAVTEPVVFSFPGANRVWGQPAFGVVIQLSF